jgi:hypothetical protein
MGLPHASSCPSRDRHAALCSVIQKLKIVIVGSMDGKGAYKWPSSTHGLPGMFAN